MKPTIINRDYIHKDQNRQTDLRLLIDLTLDVSVKFLQAILLLSDLARTRKLSFKCFVFKAWAVFDLLLEIHITS